MAGVLSGDGVAVVEGVEQGPVPRVRGEGGPQLSVHVNLSHLCSVCNRVCATECAQLEIAFLVFTTLMAMMM